MLAELTAHKPLPSAVVEQVVSRTDGVPLFVEELTRMMVESGALVEREDRYELAGALSDVEIPGTLRALITARLDRLDRAKETAQVAAALGRELSVEVLAAVSPLGPAAVQEDLDRLMAAGLVLRKRRVKDPVAVFKHALVRDAAYESLGRAARLRVHARIAGALEERFPEVVRGRPDLLAYHHAAAEQRREAVPYAQRAAQQGLERSAYAEAVTHASSVVEWAGALPAAEGVEAELDRQRRADPGNDGRSGAGPILGSRRPSTGPLCCCGGSIGTAATGCRTCGACSAYHHVASNRREARAVTEERVSIGDR